MMQLLRAGLPSTPHILLRWTVAPCSSSSSLTIANSLSTCCGRSLSISRRVSVPHSLRLSNALGSHVWGGKVRELGRGVESVALVRGRAGEEVEDRVASFDGGGGGSGTAGWGRGGSSVGDESFSNSRGAVAGSRGRGRGNSFRGSRVSSPSGGEGEYVAGSGGRGRGGSSGDYSFSSSNGGGEYGAGARGRGRGGAGSYERFPSSSGVRQYSSSSRGRGRGGSVSYQGSSRTEFNNGRERGGLDSGNGATREIEDGAWRPDRSSSTNGEPGPSFRGGGVGDRQFERAREGGGYERDGSGGFSREVGRGRGRGRGGRGSFGSSRGGRGTPGGQFQRDGGSSGYSRGRGGRGGPGLGGRGSFGRGRGSSSSFGDRNAEREGGFRERTTNFRAPAEALNDDGGYSSMEDSPLKETSPRSYPVDRNREREFASRSPSANYRERSPGSDFSRDSFTSQRGRGRGRGSFGGSRGGRGGSYNPSGQFQRDGGSGGFSRGRGGRGGQGLAGRGSYARGRGSVSSFRDRNSGRDGGFRERATDPLDKNLGYSGVDDSFLVEANSRSYDDDRNREREFVSKAPRTPYRDSSPDSDSSRDSVTSQRGGRGRGARGAGRGSRGRGGRGGALQSRGDAPARPQYGQRGEFEEKWQWMVRKKKNKGSQFDDEFDVESDDESDDELDGAEGTIEEGVLEGGDTGIGEEEEGGNEEWRRKKIGWLCKEIPGLRPSGVVTILNGQRNWIKAVDTKQIMEALMRQNEILRAHRVLKWSMQQPWYENDFELNTKMANILGNHGKLTRMREMFDNIIANGQPPDASTYAILVKAYIADQTSESLDEAFNIYNQMEQFGGYEQPAALAFSLFQAFTDRKGGAHLRHLHQADALFESIKKKGPSRTMHFTPEMWKSMYTALIHLQSVQGNGTRVDKLVADMKAEELDLHPDCYSAVIRVCAKDANVEKAERTFEELVGAGHKPDWRAYVALIQTYGAAGMPEKAQETFDGMEVAGVHMNQSVYEAIIEAMTKVGDIERAQQALERAERKFGSSLQGPYNLLMDLFQSKEMLPEIETMFKRMKENKCRPNHQSFNTLIDSYIKRGLLDKAEEIYEEMREVGGIHPNTKTFSLMIEAFGNAGRQEKVKQFYEHLTARKLKLSEEATPYVKEVVGEKKVAYEEKARPRKLVQEQREMLAGVLLGGAKMASYDNNRTYEFKFELDNRTQSGPILINHLYDMFTDWAQQAPCVEVDDDPECNNGQRSLIQFATVSHGSFRFYAHQYRPEGNPVIPRLIHRWLNPVSLAYWYMYGGSKCEENGGIILNAAHYTPKELSLVVKALKARTIDCVLKKRRSGNVICFKNKSAVWLWKLMEPHILDELKDLLRPEERDLEDGGVADDGFEEFDGDKGSHITGGEDDRMRGMEGEASFIEGVETGNGSRLEARVGVRDEEDLSRLGQAVSKEGEGTYVTSDRA